MSQETLVAELSKRLAARVTIAAGPTGPYTSGPAWLGGPLPGGGGSSAIALAKAITAWKPPPKKAAPVPAKPEQPKAPERAKPVAVPLEQTLSDNPMIARAQQAGSEAGVRTLIVADAEQAQKLWGDKADAVAADYRPNSDVILINPASRYWNQAEIDAAHARGWLSTNDPNHIINNELGHRAHRQAIGPERWSGQMNDLAEGANRTRIESQVSEYAGTKRVKFIAEVYAGMKAGKSYDAKIMQQFKSFGGVEP
jgi:hypothetical protein